jgi:hypothetical protein
MDGEVELMASGIASLIGTNLNLFEFLTSVGIPQDIAENSNSITLLFKLMPFTMSTLLRINNHGFSKFTRGSASRLTQRIHDTMAQTVADLLEHFSAASLAYTRSDETTLVFPATVTSRPFDGRVGKLARLAAGFPSTRPNHHLAKATYIPAKKTRRRTLVSILIEVERHFELMESFAACLLPSCSITANQAIASPLNHTRLG